MIQTAHIQLPDTPTCMKPTVSVGTQTSFKPRLSVFVADALCLAATSPQVSEVGFASPSVAYGIDIPNVTLSNDVVHESTSQCSIALIDEMCTDSDTTNKSGCTKKRKAMTNKNLNKPTVSQSQAEIPKSILEIDFFSSASSDSKKETVADTLTGSQSLRKPTHIKSLKESKKRWLEKQRAAKENKHWSVFTDNGRGLGMKSGKKDLCKFFIGNYCNKGDACVYSHITSDFPCRNYSIRGDCPNGERCNFAHSVVRLDERYDYVRRNFEWLLKNRERLSACTDVRVFARTSDKEVNNVNDSTATAGKQHFATGYGHGSQPNGSKTEDGELEDKLMCDESDLLWWESLLLEQMKSQCPRGTLPNAASYHNTPRYQANNIFDYRHGVSNSRGDVNGCTGTTNPDVKNYEVDNAYFFTHPNSTHPNSTHPNSSNSNEPNFTDNTGRCDYVNIRFSAGNTSNPITERFTTRGGGFPADSYYGGGVPFGNSNSNSSDSNKFGDSSSNSSGNRLFNNTGSNVNGSSPFDYSSSSYNLSSGGLIARSSRASRSMLAVPLLR